MVGHMLRRRTSASAASPGRSGPVDPRLLHYARGTRRYLLLTVVLGGVTAGLVLAQAWLIANTIADVVVHHRGLAQVRTLAVLLAMVILGRSLVAWLGERAAQRASASAKSDLRTALVERIVPARSRRHRPRTLRPPRGAVHQWHRRLGQLLRPLPPTAVSGRHRPGHRHRCDAGRRLDIGGDHRGHGPADPAVHGACGRLDEGSDATTGPAAPAPGRPLPRRGRRPPDPQGLRSGQGPGGRGPRHHEPLPHRHHGHAEGGVPLVPHPRTAGHLLCGARGRGRRPSPARWSCELRHRPLRPHPGSRGLPPAPPPRDELPRQRRRDEGGRGRLRGARATGADARQPSRRSRPVDLLTSRSTSSRSATRTARSLPSATSPSRSGPEKWWPSPVPAAVASPACSPSSSAWFRPRAARSPSVVSI